MPRWPEVWSSLLVLGYLLAVCWVLEAARFKMPEPPVPVGMEVVP